MKLLVLVLFMFGFSAFAAEEPAAKGAKFEEHKKEMLENVDKNISSLNELKSCLSGAADHAAAKPCMEKRRTTMKELRLDRMDDKMEHHQDAIKRIEERKAKMKK